MSQRTIAIMQPTYLPWAGYFDLIDQADCFVFLDSVQFNKRSWQQRNRIKGDGDPLWLTVPVHSKGRLEQRFLDVEIDLAAGFHEKHLKSIAHLYGKAPFFEQYYHGLCGVMSQLHRRLVDLNIELIQLLCQNFGIETEMLRSSTLEVTGQRVELLVNICSVLSADRYLSAAGSKSYIEENNLFGTSGIELNYHSFQHPRYQQQHGGFVPYLSVLDLLFNEGSSSLSIIRQGRVDLPVG